MHLPHIELLLNGLNDMIYMLWSRATDRITKHFYFNIYCVLLLLFFCVYVLSFNILHLDGVIMWMYIWIVLLIIFL